MKRSGIYRMFWPGKKYFYIGQSVNIDYRFKKHLYQLIKKTHPNIKLQRVFSRLGNPEIEILELSEIENLDEKEQFYLDKYVNVKGCCNICKIANSTKGYKHTEAAKKLIGKLSKQKVFTDEYRAKLKLRKPNINMLGKKVSEGTKKLMSAKRKGVKKSDSHKLSIALSNRKPRYRSEEIKNIHTGQTFYSIGEAARFYGIHKDTLAYRIKNFDNYNLIKCRYQM